MAQELKKGFLIYYDYRTHLSLLTDEDRGKLLMALLNHGENGDEPELEGAALMAYSFIASQMDRDNAKYEEKCKKRREAGLKGGRPQKAKETEEKQTKAKKANVFFEKQTKAKKPDTETDTETDTDTDNIINNIIPHNPPKGETRTSLQERRFADFWQEYPKKVGKKAALTAWKRLKLTDELFEKIMQTVEASKNSEQWIRDGGRYIPNPATWINQGRWDDEVPTAGAYYEKPREERQQKQTARHNPFLALIEGT